MDATGHSAGGRGSLLLCATRAPRASRVDQSRSDALTGIMGERRAWTVSMISPLSMPCRYTEVMPRLLCPSWRWMTMSGTPSRAISTWRRVAGGAHDRDDFFHLRRIGRVTQPFVRRRVTGAESRHRRWRPSSTGTIEQLLGHGPSSGSWNEPDYRSNRWGPTDATRRLSLRRSSSGQRRSTTSIAPASKHQSPPALLPDLGKESRHVVARRGDEVQVGVGRRPVVMQDVHVGHRVVVAHLDEGVTADARTSESPPWTRRCGPCKSFELVKLGFGERRDFHRWNDIAAAASVSREQTADPNWECRFARRAALAIEA
jgi:hypothetical protein